MTANSDLLTELNPKLEQLKQQLEEKQTRIMDVGGADYRRLKEEMDSIID